jgi:hypothetical protein
MRKFLLFIVSNAMVGGGLYLLGAEFLLADRISFGFVVAGTVLAMLGLYLLWAQFIAPAFGVEGEE